MRKKHTMVHEEESEEINLTPMLDVVFIMLIFFIVTATFIKEAGIQVERPDTVTADTQDDAAILIAISGSDEIWIDRKERAPQAVRGIIERLHAENPKGSIVIQADENSTNEVLVKVLEAAKQAGVSNVSIAADNGQELGTREICLKYQVRLAGRTETRQHWLPRRKGP